MTPAARPRSARYRSQPDVATAMAEAAAPASPDVVEALRGLLAWADRVHDEEDTSRLLDHLERHDALDRAREALAALPAAPAVLDEHAAVAGLAPGASPSVTEPGVAEIHRKFEGLADVFDALAGQSGDDAWRKAADMLRGTWRDLWGGVRR
jgi:hypothetical protein